MPTYEYVCRACQHAFEEFQKFSDEPLKRCPRCNELQLERLFGAGLGILFKGSGFYETDYRSQSYEQAAKAEQKGSSAAPPASTAPSADNGSAGDAPPSTTNPAGSSSSSH